MNDMSQAIIPRSDQWNADDFLSGPQTFKITDVQIRGGHEQPVSISVEGSGKVYRPCKSMSRVLVACWGPDASKYIGRSLTLYTDPSVIWGGMKVGGIRIAFLSDIAETITMALTATRATRKPFTVRPLAVQARSREPTEAELVAEGIIVTGNAFAANGKIAFTKFWNSLSREHRDLAGGKVQRDLWLAIATKADDAKPDDDLPTDEQTLSPAPVFTPAAERDEAAAGNAFPVERRAEPTNDLEGSAPDLRIKSTEAPIPPDASVPASSPTWPQAGAERPQPPEAVSAPATSSTPSGEPAASAYDDPDSHEAVDRDRAVRIVEIIRDGLINAGKGEASLNNYLEELVASGERSMIENATVREWRKVARDRAKK